MEQFRLDTLIDGPVIRGIGSRSNNGGSIMLSALSIAADEIPFDQQGLYGFLHFRLDTAFKARKRSFWIGGRIYNALTGQSATHVPLSGSHLRQALSCIGLQPPEQVVVQGRYDLRLDYALNAYKVLKTSLES